MFLNNISDALGCSVDAVPYLDKTCSGKRTCEYSLPSKELYATQPCPKGASSYLEVDYQCIQGEYEILL